ncbi:MAG: NAD(+)/NADH kinase [Hespellia sp.]|nr:NAD(+)/NADH kinase [Hespellia sp.]
MSIYYIVTNDLKDPHHEVTNRIKAYLTHHGNQCILSKNDPEGHIIPETVPEEMDYIIVLGGDGTLIRAARELHDYNVPLLGVNLGTLGYLAELEIADLEDGLLKVMHQQVNIETRMMLKATLSDGREGIALNDIVVSREGGLRVIHFRICVNGMQLNRYQADGIIISTPTGSTGYNLSAGGPIVEPTAFMIVITPICSHALNTSSIVLSSEDVIEIEIEDSQHGIEERAAVSLDGGHFSTLITGNRVKIECAKKTTKLVKLSKESFLKTMHMKMKGN